MSGYQLPLALDDNTLAMSPLSQAAAVVTEGEELPTLTEYAFDFELLDFKLDENGQMYTVERNEALKVWLYFALLTERYKYRANSSDYGTEIDRMMGLNVSNGIKRAELERTIKEAILICPYVKSIKSLTVENNDGLVTVEVEVESVYNKEGVRLDVNI